MSILAAYKPSAEGSAALGAAIEEARLRDAELLIVRHVEGGHDPMGRFVAPVPEGHSRAETGQDVAKLREELEALARDVALQEGIECQAVLLNEGAHAADQILGLARRGHVDLIVVGVRHRSRVGKLVLGSDAQAIILKADCAVLSVKAD